MYAKRKPKDNRSIDSIFDEYIKKRQSEKLQHIRAISPKKEPKVVKEEPISKKKQWVKYRNLVRRLTEKQDLSQLENYSLRGFRNYHVDHIISIWDGYHRGLPAQAIASISNLRIISADDNNNKGRKSDYKQNPLSSLLIPAQ